MTVGFRSCLSPWQNPFIDKDIRYKTGLDHESPPMQKELGEINLG
jgi:hypothetical protein